MTVQVELDAETESRIAAQAAASGVPLEDYVKSLIEKAAIHGAPGDATRALFAKWNEQDRNDDPAETACRNREFDEFKAAMNANRIGQRPLYP